MFVSRGITPIVAALLMLIYTGPAHADGNAGRNLAGTLKGDPSCVSWGAGRVDCFAEGTDSALHHIWEDNGKLGTWENLGGVLGSKPSCVSWGPQRIDCFVRGTDGAMHQRWFDGSGWKGWFSHGGAIVGEPSCVSRGSGLIDCFARGTDNQLHLRAFNGQQWLDWTRIAAGNSRDTNMITSPRCYASGPTKLFCVAGLTYENPVRSYLFGNVAWSGGPWQDYWSSTNGNLFQSARPACLMLATGEANCLAKDADGTVLAPYDANLRFGPTTFRMASGGPETTAEPSSCVALGSTLAACFGRGRSGQLMWNRFNAAAGAAGWDANWQPIVGTVGNIPSEGFGVTGLPECLAIGPSTLDCYYRHSSGALFRKRWANGGWLAPGQDAPGATNLDATVQQLPGSEAVVVQNLPSGVPNSEMKSDVSEKSDLAANEKSLPANTTMLKLPPELAQDPKIAAVVKDGSIPLVDERPDVQDGSINLKFNRRFEVEIAPPAPLPASSKSVEQISPGIAVLPPGTNAPAFPPLDIAYEESAEAVIRPGSIKNMFAYCRGGRLPISAGVRMRAQNPAESGMVYGLEIMSLYPSHYSNHVELVVKNSNVFAAGIIQVIAVCSKLPQISLQFEWRGQLSTPGMLLPCSSGNSLIGGGAQTMTSSGHIAATSAPRSVQVQGGVMKNVWVVDMVIPGATLNRFDTVTGFYACAPSSKIKDHLIWQGQSVDLPPRGSGTMDVTCPSGRKIVSAGFDSHLSGHDFLLQSLEPLQGSRTTWRATVLNRAIISPLKNVTATIYAVCAANP